MLTGLQQACSCMRAGSELHLAVDAAKELEAAGKKARVVSMLSWEVFEEQVRPAAGHLHQSQYMRLGAC